LVAILVLATIILPWVRDESQSGADPNLQLPLVGVALSGNGRVLFVQQDVWTVELEEEYFLLTAPDVLPYRIRYEQLPKLQYVDLVDVRWEPKQRLEVKR